MPPTYPHANLHNPTITQLYLQETPYQFQIPALDFRKNQNSFRANKTTNPHDFLFNRKTFKFMHLHLTLLNLTN